MRLEDKVIWLTGASSGIGRSLATLLAAKGARLLLTARRIELLEEARRELDPNKVRLLPADLADSSNLSDLVDRAVDVFGHVDILVANAGVSQRSTAADTDDSVVRQIMNVDFFAPVLLSRHLLPILRQRPESAIVVVSSVAGKFGTQFRSTYSAAKHALHGYFEALRLEEWKRNIQVLMVVAGFVRTAVSQNALTADGSPHDVMDLNQQNGIEPERAAAQIVRAMAGRRRNELFVGLDGRTRFGLLLNAIWPSLLFRMLKNANVT